MTVRTRNLLLLTSLSLAACEVSDDPAGDDGLADDAPVIFHELERCDGDPARATGGMILAEVPVNWFDLPGLPDWDVAVVTHAMAHGSTDTWQHDEEAGTRSTWWYEEDRLVFFERREQGTIDWTEERTYNGDVRTSRTFTSRETVVWDDQVSLNQKGRPTVIDWANHRDNSTRRQFTWQEREDGLQATVEIREDRVLDRTEVWTWDAEGQLMHRHVTSVEGAEIVLAYHYDPDGRLKRVTREDLETGRVDVELEYFREFDRQGRPVSVTEVAPQDPWTGWRQIRLGYDEQGRPNLFERGSQEPTQNIRLSVDYGPQGTVRSWMKETGGNLWSQDYRYDIAWEAFEGVWDAESGAVVGTLEDGIDDWVRDTWTTTHEIHCGGM